MTKSFYFIATLLIAFAFTSCSSDDGINGDPDNEVAAAKAAIKSKLFEAGSLDETPKAVKVENAMPYTWDKSIDILSNFPESKPPQDGTYTNFIYESKSDDPFTVVMLHSNGTYRHTCGIYWYGEDGSIEKKEFWSEFNEDETNKKWINMSGGKATVISRQDDNCGAYKITLPKGTKFGFYQQSFDKNKNPMKTGKNEYLFYSESNLNWNAKSQVMTTNKFGDKWTIVGFEDKPYDNSDKDFNDCVFAVNPQLKIVPDPDPVPEHVKGEVETNLSVTEENETDKVKLSVHVRAVTNVNVYIPITDKALADDFAIVAKHDKEYAYNEDLTINGQKVTLSYSITEDGKYLKITTSGINEEVIKYCEETYADGLTFECNFFFKDYDESRDAYITFEKEPYVYVTSSAIEATSTDVTLPDDYEVKWKEAKNIEQLDFIKESGYFKYAQEYYSTYTYEQLKDLGWIKGVYEGTDSTTEE